MKIEKVRKDLQEFANKHKVLFSDGGTCGFGRPCVGFHRSDGWIDYNPINDEALKMGDFDNLYVDGFDGDFSTPEETPNAYHKHDCLAVLVLSEGDEITEKEYDTALVELWHWIKHIEKKNGEVEIVEYENGASGIQAILSGTTGWAIRKKTSQEK